MNSDPRAIWDAEAATFDDEPDHGLRDADTRAAWDGLLVELLGVPDGPSRAADLGCGTGSLALLLAGHGHHVQGVDVSPAMLERAVAKSLAAGLPTPGGSVSVPARPTGPDALSRPPGHLNPIRSCPENRRRVAPVQFDVGDVSAPALPTDAFDVVLARHVVWALPDARASLGRWTDLLVPGGRMLLVEGFWSTQAGLHQAELIDLLDPRLSILETRCLDDPHLWGKPVDDERYAVLAERR